MYHLYPMWGHSAKPVVKKFDFHSTCPTDSNLFSLLQISPSNLDDYEFLVYENLNGFNTDVVDKLEYYRFDNLAQKVISRLKEKREQYEKDTNANTVNQPRLNVPKINVPKLKRCSESHLCLLNSLITVNTE